MKRVVFLGLLVMLLTSRLTTAQTPTPTPAAAPTPSAVPPLINYQGMLTDADGKPLAGTKKLEFNLYDKPIDGTLIWGPQTFDNVYLGNGRFNVILGTTDAAGRAIVKVFDASNRYLGMKVGEPGADLAGVKELVPRQQLLSAPYAIQAEYALHGVPAGTITAFAGPAANLPTGWLLCNGGAVKSQDYPKLYAAIGTAWGNGSDDSDPLTNFNLPDLRGSFLRGVNAGSGNDPDVASRTALKSGGNVGDNVGSKQSDVFASHNHVFTTYYNNNNGTYNAKWGLMWLEKNTMWTNTGDAIVDPRGGNETRPKNVAVNFMIKY